MAELHAHQLSYDAVEEFEVWSDVSCYRIDAAHAADVPPGAGAASPGQGSASGGGDPPQSTSTASRRGPWNRSKPPMSILRPTV
ncbi:uncharacterized protein SOCE836_076160 [Sorangium cellulosum]|uniref:Uncharacterized protein n=1 Tax=Sorangium cellulosum TaxID=56 RepID=A0A4P2QXY4_SORCE|nr:uncharacterized protein SOCE836_076160 [Sorangium cellulosum]WCQ94728.1 hypothetical protein NQZ70_07497 [Sorangium sp. Soce836]